MWTLLSLSSFKAWAPVLSTARNVVQDLVGMRLQMTSNPMGHALSNHRGSTHTALSLTMKALRAGALQTKVTPTR
jgi:hypothetical protein